MLKEQGISQIICNTENKTHQKYLYKMGYESQSVKSKTVFVKNI
jgi:Trk K+ transport system NAD-binding subunit